MLLPAKRNLSSPWAIHVNDSIVMLPACVVQHIYGASFAPCGRGRRGGPHLYPGSGTTGLLAHFLMQSMHSAFLRNNITSTTMLYCFASLICCSGPGALRYTLYTDGSESSALLTRGMCPLLQMDKVLQEIRETINRISDIEKSSQPAQQDKARLNGRLSALLHSHTLQVMCPCTHAHLLRACSTDGDASLAEDCIACTSLTVMRCAMQCVLARYCMLSSTQRSCRCPMWSLSPQLPRRVRNSGARPMHGPLAAPDSPLVLLQLGKHRALGDNL